MKILRTNLLSILCLLAMLAAGFSLYPGLPETIPTQYGFDGRPGNVLAKSLVLALMPFAYIVSIITVNLLVHYSPEKFSMPNSKRPMDTIIFAVGLLLLAVHIGLLRAVGDAEVFVQYLSIGLALFLIITGNVFGKTERNFFVGVRIPWTIASEDNWRATHRFAGRLMVLSGIALLVTSYLSPSLPLTLILGVSWAALAVIYSFFFYIKNERSTK